MIMNLSYKFLYMLFVDHRVDFFPAIQRKYIDVKNPVETRIRRLIENHCYEQAAALIRDNRLEKDGDIQRLYAYCLQNIGDKRANEIMGQYVKEKYGVEINDLKRFLSDKDGIDINAVEYEYPGGLANVGFLFTRNQGGDILTITKILETDGIGNEEFFYEKILPLVNGLEVFAPQYIRAIQYNCKIRLMTMQYIIPVEVNQECDGYVIKAIELLNGISGAQLKVLCRGRILYRGNSEVSELHKGLTIKMMREKMQLILRKTPDADELAQFVDGVMNRILKDKIYRSIVPDIHYVLCHNDFHRKNIFGTGNGIRIFDWNNYRYGLIGWDLAYYWGNFELPFSDILEKYIIKQRNAFSLRKDALAWDIFFSVCLVYVWVARLHGRFNDDYLNYYFMPALNHIKDGMDEIKKGIKEKAGEGYGTKRQKEL